MEAVGVEMGKFPTVAEVASVNESEVCMLWEEATCGSTRGSIVSWFDAIDS